MHIQIDDLKEWLNHRIREDEDRDSVEGRVRCETFQEVIDILNAVEARDSLRRELNTRITMRASIWKDLERDLDVDEDHYWRAAQHNKLAMIEEDIADLEIKVGELNRDLEKTDWEEV